MKFANRYPLAGFFAIIIAAILFASSASGQEGTLIDWTTKINGLNPDGTPILGEDFEDITVTIPDLFGGSVTLDVPIRQAPDRFRQTLPHVPLDDINEVGGNVTLGKLPITRGLFAKHRAGMTVSPQIIIISTSVTNAVAVPEFEAPTADEQIVIDGEIEANTAQVIEFEIKATLDGKIIPPTDGHYLFGSGFYLDTAPDNFQPSSEFFFFDSRFPTGLVPELFDRNSFSTNNGITIFDDEVIVTKQLTVNPGDVIYFDTFSRLQISNTGVADAQLDFFNTAEFELTVKTPGVSLRLIPEPTTVALFLTVACCLMKRRSTRRHINH